MVLRLKLDENLPTRAELALRSLGHDVETVPSERLTGATDPRLLDAVIAEGRILVTLDLDFADIRAYPPGMHCGIWVLRPARQTFDAVLQLTLVAARLAVGEPTEGRLWVIDDQRVRIRE